MWRKFRIFESVILRKKRHDLNVWFITSNFWIPVWWYNITDYFIVFQRGIWGIGCCCFTNFIRCTDKQKQQGQLCVLTFFWGIGGTKYATISPRILEVQNFLPWPTPFLVLSVPHESSRDPAQSISGASMDRPALAAQNQHQQGGRGDSRSDFIDHGVSGEAGGRSCPICYNCGVEVICRRLVTSFRKDPLIQMQMSLLSQGYWPGCTSSCPWAKNCELYSMCMSQALLCQCPVLGLAL